MENFIFVEYSKTLDLLTNTPELLHFITQEICSQHLYLLRNRKTCTSACPQVVGET